MSAAVEWEPIQGFTGRLEYERFVAWLDGLIAAGRAVELGVERPYAPSLAERWVARAEDGAAWRLVEPDAPFAGVFEPVAGGG
jgi:hypothetical protein